jgi:hypothetical protein
LPDAPENLILSVQFYIVMRRFQVYWLALLTCCLLGVACGGKKKKTLSGDDPVTVQDFIDFYTETGLPFAYGDTIFNKRPGDSLLISYKVISQFIPDSVLAKVTGKQQKAAKYYPLARIKGRNKESFLFTNTYAGNKKISFVSAFDKGGKFIAAMPALVPDALSNTQQQVSMDRSISVTKLVTRKNADGSVNQGQDVFALDPSTGQFVLVMTDPLDEKVGELLNPIDSFSRKQKYTADYTAGKRSLVSVRDGRRSDRITFFIHFEKEGGECTGDLKGEATMINANTAEYRVGGDPCVLQFRFTNSSVTLHEVESCGNRRGLRCSFDGSFARKKEPAKPKTKKN